MKPDKIENSQHKNIQNERLKLNENFRRKREISEKKASLNIKRRRPRTERERDRAFAHA